MKIRIIGLPGSGKSTLARTLFKKLNIENVNLDQTVFYVKPNKKKIPISASKYKKEINKVVSKSNWIVEGTSTFTKTFKKQISLHT